MTHLNFFKFLLLLTFVVGIKNLHSQTPAFPTAEGCGKWATGGRGGEVVEVTTTADDGVGNLSGSLRWAVKQHSGKALTVVFKVSGVIDLNGVDLRIQRDNLTIAGQTAPGDGICIRRGEVNLGGSKNIIVRHLRFRTGAYTASGTEINKASIRYENGGKAIFDHISASWSAEELADFCDGPSITVQWSIFTEALYNSVNAKGSRSYGPVLGGSSASYHHNLLAHTVSRTPRFGVSTETDVNMLVDYVNNVLYNYAKSNGCYGGENEMATAGSVKINMVNNYYKQGPAYSAKVVITRASYETGIQYNAYSKYHLSGNYIQGTHSTNATYNADNYAGLDFDDYLAEVPATTINNLKSSSRHTTPETVTTETAANAFNSVMAKSGAFPRDITDSRAINEAKNGTASKKGTFNSGATCGIIDKPEDAGGWQTYSTYNTVTDTDKDGMPDNFETANGLNPNSAPDKNNLTSQGYTYLEAYINGIVGEYLSGVTYPGISNPATLTKHGSGSSSQTVTLGSAITSFYYTWANATSASATGLPSGVTYALDAANKNITISGTPTVAGTFNYSITTTGGSPNATVSGTLTVNNTTSTLVYQGENAVINTGVTETKNAGYTGTGYANADNAIGTYVEWTVTTSTAGSFNIFFRYASVGDRPSDIYVNGTKVISALAFPTTTVWTTWANTATQTVSLINGANKIRTTATTASGCANLDYLSVTGSGTLKSMKISNSDVSKGPVIKLSPNPITESSDISFNLDTESVVSIKILNNQGKLIREVVSKNVAPGTHNYPITKNGLSKGIYLCKITLNGKTQVIKMIVSD